MEGLYISEISIATPEIAEKISALASQLSSTPFTFQEPDLAAIIDSENSTIFSAYYQGSLIGILVLIRYRVPIGMRGLIESFTVDRRYRNRGVGTALLERAVHRAHEIGIQAIDLTSRPTRIAANNLYRRHGFTPRQTNAYRLAIRPPRS